MPNFVNTITASRRYILVLITAVLSFATLVWFPGVAQASDWIVSDETSCLALPAFSIWEEGAKKCHIHSDLTISDGHTLRIADGVGFVVRSRQYLKIRGGRAVVSSGGYLKISDARLLIESGQFTNKGVIEFGHSIAGIAVGLYVDSGAVFINQGELLYGSATIVNSGFFHNTWRIQGSSGSGFFFNEGILTNFISGYIRGILSNRPGGQINNYGTIEGIYTRNSSSIINGNGGQWTVLGPFFNESGSVMRNSGTLNIQDSLSGPNSMEIHAGSLLVNEAVGIINVKDEFNSIINGGSIRNLGSIHNGGIVANGGFLCNGTFTGNEIYIDPPLVCDDDADNDGLNNGFELEIGTHYAIADSDNDGLDDGREVALSTNPLDADSDDDGLDDGDDAFPNDSSESSDNDGDGIGDNADPDDDNDGVNDINDAFPNDSSESSDNDGDNIGDNADLDDDNDGQSDVDEQACGSNPLNGSSTSSDFDGDYSPDCVDPDDDNDGINDGNDACPFENPNGVDANSDGCIDVLDDLPSVVEGLGLPQGTENSLLSKVNNALAALEKGDTQAVNNMLEAFTNEVYAHQSGRKMTEADAAMLIAFAQNILDGLP